MSKINSIECALIRGGTSKGVYIRSDLLPSNRKKRNELLLQLLGSDSHQFDGLGGGNSLSSKVALVSASRTKGSDVDYKFVQVMPARGVDDTIPCGNILSGVAPFAIEMGIIKATRPTTVVRIRDINTKTIVSAKLQTPHGRIVYDGKDTIPGTQHPGTPVILEYQDIGHGITGKLWPTGRKTNIIHGAPVSLIDGAIPVAISPITSYGFPTCAKIRSLNLRNKIDVLLGMRESVAKKGGIKTKGTSVPKVALVAKPTDKDADILVRYFTPHTPHNSIAVTGAISIAMASLVKGTVAYDFCKKKKTPKPGESINCSIEHLAGVFNLELVLKKGKNGELVPDKAKLFRTARLLMKGEAQVPVY